MKRAMERESLFPHFRPCLIYLPVNVQNGPAPPMVEEVIRHLVVSSPLICECAKEERCINASVDGIVAVKIRGNIERVRNVCRAVEAADMIPGKQDRCHGRTNRNELFGRWRMRRAEKR